MNGTSSSNKGEEAIYMMGTAAVIGLSAGKSLLRSSFYYSDLTDKLLAIHDQYQTSSTKNVIAAATKSSSFDTSYPSNRKTQSIKALKEHVDTLSAAIADAWLESSDNVADEGDYDIESSVEALLLLQRSMLEKQWNLSFEQRVTKTPAKKNVKKIMITTSGVSARKRRSNTRIKALNTNSLTQPSTRNKQLVSVSSDLLQIRFKGLKNRLGYDPTDEELAASLSISHAQLQSKLLESSLAREKLAMSNVRLVLSIAQKYDNMGAEMADLVQGGLIGLLRGIEKFDSSKGFKISTYVYWWIRQGVSRALVENSRTLRLPTHLHERLSLIRNAKLRLEEQGITPSIAKIAESLNMSQKKIRNATEAISRVFSLDREAFPSLNGLPGETLHSYIADNRRENNPWHGVDEWLLKDEVNDLISSTLGAREQDIIRLYYGLDKECLTWEDISRRIGLSRERVRQVGLVALEKLKHAARKRKLEAMLVKH
ncbi:hypothetical protein Scep_027172 [Stephania cephalantha]|uniref:RNA polymerase sigma-70 domain-containing protein n=1 Tax=Stephania cephalantha TaxID=152367 RepID=A0AAP0ES55_9MAGN